MENELVKLVDYAKIKGVGIDSLKEKARKGIFKTAIKKGKTWYAEKTELDTIYCDYKVLSSKDFINLEEYASLYGINQSTLHRAVQFGQYKTAVKYKRRWYIDKNEKPALDDYLTITEYAKLHNKPRSEILKLVNKGLIKSIKFNDKGGNIYIPKNEKLINYISLNKYANIHNVPYYRILDDAKNNVYSSVKVVNTKWYIDMEEPCMTQSFKRDMQL